MLGTTFPHKQYTSGRKGMDGPNSPYEALQSAKGNPFSGLEHRRFSEKCIVTAVNTERYTCTVFTEFGALLEGVPFPDGGDTVPKIKSVEYAVNYGLGEPTLERVVMEPATTEVEVEMRVSGVASAGNPGTSSTNTGRGKRRANKPSDVLPGDWVKQGSTGQLVGVLEGGVVLVKASELAQIILSQASNLVRVLGKNVVMDTGMGTLALKTVDGKSTLDLSLGSDESTESDPDAENFRIRAELGANGEMVDFRVTDGDGRAVYRLHIDPDGRVQSQALRKTAVIDEDLVLEVGTTIDVSSGGSANLQAGGEVRAQASGNISAQSSGSVGVSSSQDISMSAVGSVQVAGASGVSIAARADGVSPSFSVTTSNGDVNFDVGSPANGQVSPLGSSFNVNSTFGDILLNTTLGQISLNSSRPLGCKLGGGGPGIYGAVLYEQLAVLLQAIAVYLDTHTHNALGTPTSPPLLPSSTIITPALPLLRSNFVTLGG